MSQYIDCPNCGRCQGSDSVGKSLGGSPQVMSHHTGCLHFEQNCHVLQQTAKLNFLRVSNLTLGDLTCGAFYFQGSADWVDSLASPCNRRASEAAVCVFDT